MSSAEGFGLGTCESLMAGTMIIANVTGGLQDQMRFIDENNNPIQFTKDWGSNHDGRYIRCGEWAVPLFPIARSLVGSIPTPYIFDSRCLWEHATEALKEVYAMGREERKRKGALGREWTLSNESMMSSGWMCSN